MARALLIAVAVLIVCSAGYATEDYSAVIRGCCDDTPGTQCWNYTASNTSQASRYYIYQLLVCVDFDTFVTNAIGPLGWNVYYEDEQPDHFVSWTCDDPQHYVGAGSELGGFTVFYSRRPDTQSYSADFGSLLDEDERRNETGEIVLPEPESLGCGLFGLTALGALLRKRSR